MASPSALSDDFAVLNDALAAGSLFPASEVAGAGRSVVLACSAAALKATTSRSFGSGKRYQVDLLPELGCLTPVFIGTSLAKNVVFKVVFLLIDQLEDPENEHSIDYGKLLGPELRFYTAKKVTKVLSEAVVKDMGKYYLQRRIELLLKGKITDRYLRKLTKSLTKSAMRKAERHGSRLVAARLMIKTGFWGSLLGNLALFLIEEGVTGFIYTYRYFRGPKPKDAELPVSLRRETNQPPFLRFTLDNVSRGVGTVYCEAFGAAIGTAILPGTGTFIGQLLFGCIPMFF